VARTFSGSGRRIGAGWAVRLSFKGTILVVSTFDAPRNPFHKNNNASATIAVIKRGKIRPPFVTDCTGGSMGRICGPVETAGGAWVCACRARFNASLIKLMGQYFLPIRAQRGQLRQSQSVPVAAQN